MKILKYIIAGLMPLLLLCSCEDDNVGNPSFADDEIPYIYMEWAGTYVYSMGDTVRFTAQVSPMENTSCRWLVDGNVVSETPSIKYVIESDEPFTLRFEAERNGMVNYRTAQVTVTKEFSPKTYDHIVMGVVTPSCNTGAIQWDYVTHLMCPALTVSDTSGKAALPDAKDLANIKTIVSLAHNNGVYVIADVTGPLSYPTGAGTYNETSFNTVAADPALRASLIADIKSFVEEYEFDGVNIYINNLNNDAGSLQDPDGLVDFFNDLDAAFPAEREAPYDHFFLTASVPMAWNNYEFYFLGRARRLDWINLLLFGGTDLSPVHHSPDWQVNDNIARFRDAAGIAPSRMLVGIGAFGVKYDIPAGVSPTWGDLDTYLSYPTYDEIVKIDANAPSGNMLSQGSATTFYVGVSAPESSVESKANIALDNGVAGMFVWTLDYDTQNPTSSLTQAVYRKMNP